MTAQNHWTRIDAPAGWTELGYTAGSAFVREVQVFQRRLLRAIRSVDNGRLHLSVSREERLPTWADVRDARYDLLPDELTFAMLLPPREIYVNVHPNTFHLWEVDDPREDDAEIAKLRAAITNLEAART